MAEIVRAEKSGFCFGVKSAIARAEELLSEGGKVYASGQLIHNKAVMADFKNKGLILWEEASREGQSPKPGDIVLIRSHGEPEAFYELAKGMGLRVCDATCPFVAKIHKLVRKAHCAGKAIILAGDIKHPELKGIAGWCENSAYAALEPDEINALFEAWKKAASLPKSILLVSQTTFQREKFEEIAERLKECALECEKTQGQEIELEIHDTICSATFERQEACKRLAENSDAMVVIGDKESSNSRKLYEIAKKYCKKSFFIENISDLCLQNFTTCNKIGVSAGASVPEQVIMEVIANMSEQITSNMETNPMSEFMEEIDKSLRIPRSGEIVNGTVIQVTDKEVIVNLGCKKDGIIPTDEVSLEEGKTLKDLFKEGDEVQAKVVRTDDGDIILSKKKLEVNEHWDEIENAMNEKETINVKLIRQVKGGVIAAYKEVTGFIPLSQLSDKYVENADEFIGKIMPVRVTRVDKMRGRTVFSHRVLLSEERAKRVAEVWNTLNVGDTVEGTVMRFTEYGAFVDIGGIDGLLHISEISWGKLRNPQEVLKIGQKIQVKVLAMNEEKGKISLGLKQTQPEPWSVIDEKYAVGQTVSGKVVQIKEYGAFVELEPGLDGLVHISEVAHKRVTNISDEISLGQTVETKILEIDKERRRISLSIKACLPEPGILDEEAPAAPAPAEEAAPVEEAPEAEEAAVEEAADEAAAAADGEA